MYTAAVNEIEATLAALTLEEKISLLAGRDFWRTVSVPDKKIPSIKVSDGPSGARGDTFSGGQKAAFFPSGISMGATFNPDLAFEVGQHLAEEVKSKSASVLLAPTACCHRSPLGGRNFESYSEDPLLSGKMASGYIRGVQSRGVAATMKHFVANEQETQRLYVDEIIDETPLREIYLKPFEIAMREGRPWAVMTAYNSINGHHCDMHPFTLKQVLRGEWGYDGLVMSDWFGTSSTVESLLAGLDLEMPGPAKKRSAKNLLAKAEGDVEIQKAVHEAARRILTLIAKVGKWKDMTPEAPEVSREAPETAELIRRAGGEGVVLLKNDDQMLPLKPASLKKVAFIGPNAKATVAGGGGSAHLNPNYLTQPYDSFVTAVRELNSGIEVPYATGCILDRWVPVVDVEEGHCKITTPDSIPGLRLEWFRGYDATGPVVSSSIQKSGNLFLIDQRPPELSPSEKFSAKVSGRISVSADGKYNISLSTITAAKLFFDGALLIDNWDFNRRGDLMMNVGSEEVVKTVELTANKWYDVSIVNASLWPKESPRDPPMEDIAALGIRFGVAPVTNNAALIAEAAAVAKGCDAVVVVVGLTNEWESESYDRTDTRLPNDQDDLIAAIAAINDNVVVINQSGSAVDMPWSANPKVKSIVQAWYGGQEAGHVLADVLLGKQNPSGKLPMTFPVKLADNPTHGLFPGKDLKSEYKEGLMVGYRYYDTANVKPQFPFGYGLSYSTFTLGKPGLSASELGEGRSFTVAVDVTNTGAVAGAEVVQLYVQRKTATSTVEKRPVKELKGFKKVHLQPGETKAAEVVVGDKELGVWSAKDGRWVVETGEYEVLVGTSSVKEELKVAGTITVKSAWSWVY
ncbi:Beta-glucosidase [Drechslerella dactyloides]|uniref:beta-glucosidase n=1 Tax=Drechslerella dactyloides TaxID=74499 RepID=A0AAD6NKX6_DREDA|nr:Beta-glucosidase [Drechslerella dactyloides]